MQQKRYEKCDWAVGTTKESGNGKTFLPPAKRRGQIMLFVCVFLFKMFVLLVSSVLTSNFVCVFLFKTFVLLVPAVAWSNNAVSLIQDLIDFSVLELLVNFVIFEIFKEV